MSPANTIEPIEMPFGELTRVGSGNDDKNKGKVGVQILQREGAIFGGCPSH